MDILPLVLQKVRDIDLHLLVGRRAEGVGRSGVRVLGLAGSRALGHIALACAIAGSASIVLAAVPGQKVKTAKTKTTPEQAKETA